MMVTDDDDDSGDDDDTADHRNVDTNNFCEESVH